MKRKKKLPTRRRRALCCAGVTLLLLLLAQNCLHTALLLPIQAVRLQEALNGVQDTRVICRQWEPGIHHGTGLFYLTANDRAVLLSNISLTVHGWQSTRSSLLDCSGDQPLHAAQSSIYRITRPVRDQETRFYGTHYVFYGRVDDPEIETVEIYIQGAAGSGDSPLIAPMFQRDGQRYFLLYRYIPGEERPDREERNRVVGRDRNGNAAADFPIELVCTNYDIVPRGRAAI